MKGKHLGEFEEIVLLTVGILSEDAYAVAVSREIEDQTGRNVNISAVHSTLYRLQKKGLLGSMLGRPTAKRGGKRKRIFTITQSGRKAMDETMNLRVRLRAQIPPAALPG